jgi:hypothetical protein
MRQQNNTPTQNERFSDNEKQQRLADKEARSAQKKQTDVVRDALKRTYRRMDEKLLEQTTQETVLAPQDRIIMVGSTPVKASDLRFKLAEKIDNPNAGGLSAAEDLQMMVASSIEAINSETSSSQEYFRWLDETSTIIKNMNDGFVSEADLKERNDFIAMSHQRETELLVCLALYSGSNSQAAREKAENIRYKLKKLREMRSAIEATTKNQADKPVTEEEYHRALPYYKMYKGLAAMPFGYALPYDRQKALGIENPDDEDLPDNRTVIDQLINAMLDDMHKTSDEELTFSQDFEYVPVTALEAARNADKEAPAPVSEATPNTKEQSEYYHNKLAELSDKMKELAGRKQTFGVRYSKLEALRCRA